MQGLVPQHILNRTSKDHAGLEWYAGLREHRAELHAWAQDSHLVAQGLANQPALRQALLSPDTLQQGAAALEATLGTEAWLRDLAAYPTPAYLAEHTHEPATRH
jgi:asparagine synthase (glutamine-hydrolysing)